MKNQKVTNASGKHYDQYSKVSHYIFKCKLNMRTYTVFTYLFNRFTVYISGLLENCFYYSKCCGKPKLFRRNTTDRKWRRFYHEKRKHMIDFRIFHNNNQDAFLRFNSMSIFVLYFSLLITLSLLWNTKRISDIFD